MLDRPKDTIHCYRHKSSPDEVLAALVDTLEHRATIETESSAGGGNVVSFKIGISEITTTALVERQGGGTSITVLADRAHEAQVSEILRAVHADLDIRRGLAGQQ
jgi:hypothetical protein